MKNEDLLSGLNDTFGNYRAEWLKDRIFNLFTYPSFFRDFQCARPQIIEGGRGTGKTTILRGLSYEGQYALRNNNISNFLETSYIGIYYRVSTNHVRSFEGMGLSRDHWNRLFGHYFNLLVCRELSLFLIWYNEKSKDKCELSLNTSRNIARALKIKGEINTFDDFLKVTDSGMWDFQSDINNLRSQDLPHVSMLGDPIELYCEEIQKLIPFRRKNIFLLIDEYENFSDDQQQLINTLIKHSSKGFLFKIGVRELGWRIRYTLNEKEQLNDPADYIIVNIEKIFSQNESVFSDFAKAVCQKRIGEIIHGDASASEYDIENAFGNLSIEDEAVLLGVKDHEYIEEFRKELLGYPNNSIDISPLYQFFLVFWARTHNKSIDNMIDLLIADKRKMDIKYENYKYEMLFKIKKGRGSSGIRKYYSGWPTYIKLANGNIRYLMELVYRAYEKQILDSDARDIENISNVNQTLAAQELGVKNLIQLEGLAKNGPSILRLVLALGRLFQVMAKSENSGAPEKVQFTIQNDEIADGECESLLTSAVMNLALIRSSGNKLSEVTQTRDFDYMLHPIFAPCFEISHRKKRKITLSQHEVLGLTKSTKMTLGSILEKTKVLDRKSIEVPSQLTLFEEYIDEV